MNSHGRINVWVLSGWKRILLVWVLFWMLGGETRLWADAVTRAQAGRMVNGWLRIHRTPLGEKLGEQIGRIDVFGDDDGTANYFVVNLEPTGYVIVPGDDGIVPIVAIVAKGAYRASPDHPLGVLVERDLPQRVQAVRALQTRLRIEGNRESLSVAETAQRDSFLEARMQWSQLNDYSGSIGALGIAGVSEIWVAPLSQSTWGQSNVGGYEPGINCYNYYTLNHWPCGCVATAMSQLMRYHEHPTGLGYDWDMMPLQPDETITDNECREIGWLCYQAAESVGTTYGPTGSSASLSQVDQALTGQFRYSQLIFGYRNSLDIGSGLPGMINPNLDAELPVILGLRNTSGGGHAIVCDGYGYHQSTLYHHLNMGWDGYDNAWYALPLVEAYYTYTIIDTCLYNIYTSGSGEIISGRITDPGGRPLSGAVVSARQSGADPNYTVTDEHGIYAFAHVPAQTTFTIGVSHGNWHFTDQVITTGRSWDNSSVSGNRWGVNFTGIISAGFIEFERKMFTVSENVSLRLVDSDLQGQGSRAVTVTICGGDRETVVLAESPAGSGVFIGAIPSAASAPIIGDGTLQTLQSERVIGTYEDENDGTDRQVTVRDQATLAGTPVLIHGTDFTSGLPAGWTIENGLSDGHTWRWDNAYGRSNPNWSGTFMLVDSDLAGNVDMDEGLITAPIDCSGYTNIILRFRHYFCWWGGGLNEKADVDVRVGGGGWETVVRYEGADAQGQVELTLPSYVDDQSDLRIRWHYHNAFFEYYWGIDDVEIRGSASPVVLRGDLEPDCVVNLADLSILAASWLNTVGGDHWNPTCDLAPPEGMVDMSDLMVLVENWLKGTP